MKKGSLSLILFFAFSLIGLAQSTMDTEKLDRYFEALEANDKFMGSLAVSKNGKIIYSKAVGYIDLENKQKANEQSKYRIGSISKTFTAVLVFKALEANQLNLDQTIDQWFPSIENADRITINHLLYHRSGIPNYTNREDYLEWNTKAKSEEEMIAMLAESGSDFEPDSQATYSNSNYLLLSYILEQTHAQSFAKLLQTQLIKPIGLSNTYLFDEIQPAENECLSYSYSGSWEQESETDFTVPLGAGAITSTPSDLTKFADALFRGKLLKKESLEQMKTMQSGFGMGLFQIPFYDKVGYGHTGGIDGFSSVFTHFEEDGITYTMCSNGSNYNNNNISIAVLSAVFDKTFEVPEFTTYEVSSADLDQYLGVYASEQIALKITVTKEGNTLIAQGTAQPQLALEAIDKNVFSFDRAGAKFTFFPAEKRMILLQGGGEIEFTKE